MKLSPRLGRSTAQADLPASDDPPPPPPPAPPRGSPVAAYAGVLDGHTLWLAVDAVPGTLALRDDAGGVHVLDSDLPEHDPAYRSVRSDLLDLPGADEGGYDVVVVPARGRTPRTVWTAPFERTPMRVPPAPGGDWQFALVRTEEGMLRVRRSRPEPRADVLEVGLTDDGIRVVLAQPPQLGRGEPLLLALDGGEVVARYRVERHDDTLVAVITCDGLPEGRDQVVRWALGSPEAWVLTRRRANDLVNPNAAVLLPVLPGPDSEDRLRLRYGPDGALAARVVGVAEEGEDA
ncbi:hypothetical protein [Nocardioides sp. T2.26MG-1]|uniref:hypothetical protein n=1 Tax=Nocardioides sp. T2.26MG-1 TaxID=3041166 RepID=UPI0024776C9F|nr:hypothetical protein [Nocardioides sp. T2.26MG-1]CAI9398877.1 hypothetical protein HIDPHFAB_00081 [Nocardioides sp. T2.26MG-1]